jgi:hypothetical protein
MVDHGVVTNLSSRHVQYAMLKAVELHLPIYHAVITNVHGVPVRELNG